MDGFQYAEYVKELAKEVYDNNGARPVTYTVWKYNEIVGKDELVSVMIDPRDEDKVRLDQLQYYYREI